MPDTSGNVTTRLADARRSAESKLRDATPSIKVTDDYAVYLPAITSFAAALFDSEAGELIDQHHDEASFEKELESELAPRVIEGILPDRGLQKVTETMKSGNPELKIEVDLDTSLLEEVDCNGTPQLGVRRYRLDTPRTAPGNT